MTAEMLQEQICIKTVMYVRGQTQGVARIPNCLSPAHGQLRFTALIHIIIYLYKNSLNDARADLHKHCAQMPFYWFCDSYPT